MKRTLILILFLLVAPPSLWAEETQNAPLLDQATIDKTNEVIKKIYDDVLAVKPKYKELAAFDEKALSKNDLGFYMINYEAPPPPSARQAWPYAFGLSVDALKGKMYADHEGYFNYPLPLVGLQFSGYLTKHPIRRQFDIKALVDRYGENMIDYQQQFMPLRFFIFPEKETYHVGETIHFKVVLANVTKHNILVKDLSQDSLFFTLNREFWGTKAGDVQTVQPTTPFELMVQQQQQMRGQIMAALNIGSLAPETSTTERGPKTKVGDQLILRANEALTIGFTGEGYKKVQDLELRGIYQLNIQGIKPTAKVTLKIVE